MQSPTEDRFFLNKIEEEFKISKNFSQNSMLSYSFH